MGPERLFSTAEIREYSIALDELWFLSMKRSRNSLDADLQALRVWFDPVAQGQRLRRAVESLVAPTSSIANPGEPFTLSVGDSKLLVTPEGRCLMDLLDERGSESDVWLDRQSTASYDRRLANLYRVWCRHRIQTVVDLREGTTKPLQIPAAAVVIALLVNRCTSETRALTRFAAGTPRNVVDSAFFEPVKAFSDNIAPSKRRNSSDPKLVSGWMLYEAKRRLGNDLVVRDARQGSDGAVWIRENHETDVIDRIAKDLARGHRARVSQENFGRAFDALVVSLRQELSKLAGYGLVHERPSHTRRLREQFLDAVLSHSSDADQ
jgi:hypothetical protein